MPKRLKAIFLPQKIVISLLVTAATALWANPLQAQARPKTDVVILKNGDRITGEIKGLDLGILTLKTDWMGTVEIEWDNIERVKSSFRYNRRVPLRGEGRRVARFRRGNPDSDGCPESPVREKMPRPSPIGASSRSPHSKKRSGSV